MTNTLTVKTSGDVAIGDKQAQFFALSICTDVKAYVRTHKAEFEAWVKAGGTIA